MQSTASRYTVSAQAIFVLITSCLQEHVFGELPSTLLLATTIAITSFPLLKVQSGHQTVIKLSVYFDCM
jgi:hypothetical protein